VAPVAVPVVEVPLPVVEVEVLRPVIEPLPLPALSVCEAAPELDVLLPPHAARERQPKKTSPLTQRFDRAMEVPTSIVVVQASL
jgi:hypothetical protein